MTGYCIRVQIRIVFFSLFFFFCMRRDNKSMHHTQREREREKWGRGWDYICCCCCCCERGEVEIEWFLTFGFTFLLSVTSAGDMAVPALADALPSDVFWLWLLPLSLPNHQRVYSIDQLAYSTDEPCWLSTRQIKNSYLFLPPASSISDEICFSPSARYMQSPTTLNAVLSSVLSLICYCYRTKYLNLFLLKSFIINDIFEGLNHHSIVVVRQVETKKDFYLLVETVNRVIFYLVVNV